MPARNGFSRVIYRTVYAFLYLILVGLLLITPGDAIRRSLDNKQSYNVLIFIVCYVATIVIILFVYALRLYINKTALSAIPKAWIPIEKGDVKDRVYRMISAGLQRSAAITYLSRPRERDTDDDDGLRRRPDTAYTQPRPMTDRTAASIGRDLGLELPPQDVLWGKIEQLGWGSPNSTDLPNLQYTTVLSELPNLIEAKALTLAPTDPESIPDQPSLDTEVIELLQRDPTMTLRQYLESLADLGVIDMNATVTDFLAQYEYARFSNRPISNVKFRSLMHLFAELLRCMTSPDLDYNPEQRAMESDIDSNGPGTTPLSHVTRSITSSTTSSRQGTPMRRTSQYATAPNTPGSRHVIDMLSRKRSNNSLATSSGSVRRGRGMARSQKSNASLRSAGTSSSGSVIRLATNEDRSQLPYVLSLKRSNS